MFSGVLVHGRVGNKTGIHEQPVSRVREARRFVLPGKQKRAGSPANVDYSADYVNRAVGNSPARLGICAVGQKPAVLKLVTRADFYRRGIPPARLHGKSRAKIGPREIGRSHVFGTPASSRTSRPVNRVARVLGENRGDERDVFAERKLAHDVGSPSVLRAQVRVADRRAVVRASIVQIVEIGKLETAEIIVLQGNGIANPPAQSRLRHRHRAFRVRNALYGTYHEQVFKGAVFGRKINPSAVSGFDGPKLDWAVRFDVKKTPVNSRQNREPIRAIPTPAVDCRNVVIVGGRADSVIAEAGLIAQRCFRGEIVPEGHGRGKRDVSGQHQFRGERAAYGIHRYGKIFAGVIRLRVKKNVRVVGHREHQFQVSAAVHHLVAHLAPGKTEIVLVKVVVSGDVAETGSPPRKALAAAGREKTQRLHIENVAEIRPAYFAARVPRVVFSRNVSGVGKNNSDVQPRFLIFNCNDVDHAAERARNVVARVRSAVGYLDALDVVQVDLAYVETARALGVCRNSVNENRDAACVESAQFEQRAVSVAAVPHDAHVKLLLKKGRKIPRRASLDGFPLDDRRLLGAFRGADYGYAEKLLADVEVVFVVLVRSVGGKREENREGTQKQNRKCFFHCYLRCLSCGMTMPQSTHSASFSTEKTRSASSSLRCST